MVETVYDKKILNTAKKILLEYPLCDYCLGRVFSKIEKNVTNKERGEKIRNLIKKQETNVVDCWLCSGLMDEIPHFAQLIEDSLKEYEYDTFLVGSIIDEEILEREEKLLEYTGSQYSESIKTEINREVGKILEKKLGKIVDFEKPTIMAVVDTAFDVVDLQIAPLLIYGRYRKYSRELPQTKWFCKICRGRGCKKCGYTGKLYPTSVEELVAEKILEITGGSDESFHGCGREDIDARMLGNGRPFVLEVKNPKVRSINLLEVKEKINSENKDLIEVTVLRFSNWDEVVRIKNSSFNKIYRVVLKCEKPINREKLKKAVQALRGLKINQLTPSRVAHRRANMVREKQIYNCEIESIDGDRAVLTLEAESGTYIKELVSGDNGRTTPSISEMIDVPCRVVELDVIDIKGE
ncbi:MAG: tRNA pseudouridine(54/55) synthase Pus10 [Thermoplasmata archaeon]|nr:MAG: tRNA pseudouridine(54/55) synthase Pus10 [Thermoplasmata archaeon]